MQELPPLSRRRFLALSGGTAIGLAMGGRASAAPFRPIDLSGPAASVGLTDEEVGQAIERYKQALWNNHNADGSFHIDDRYMRTHGTHGMAPQGGTVLAALAMVATGESIQGEKLQQTVTLLEQYQPTNMYELSLAGHLWSYLPPQYLSLLHRVAERLLLSQAKPGVWDTYEPVMRYGEALQDPHNYLGRNCLSVTQYGVLGLWQARKRGVEVPDQFWKQAAEVWLSRQGEDGSWHYSDQNSINALKPTQKMTCAGVTILYVCQQELFRDAKTANPAIQAAIDKGLSWLEENFSLQVDGFMNDLHGYQYYGYERVALASGRVGFGPNCPDWYRTIGRRLVDAGPTGNTINDALNLMFLAGGRVPVWCSKVRVPGANWNNRPNDLYFANRFLSEMRENEYTWVLADIDRPAEHWMIAPLAYLSTDKPIVFTPDQLDNLRRYTALGGLLVINPETRDALRWAEELCASLFPEYTLRPVPAEHFLYDGLDARQAGRVKARAVSNGAREQVVVFDDDQGHRYQSETKPDVQDPHWRVLFNLFCLSTDRGRPHRRLSAPYAQLKPARPQTTVAIGVVRYEGNWRPEPGCYALAKHALAERFGLGIEETEVTLDGVDPDGPAKLLHLMGVEEIELTAQQLERIEGFVRGGGTLLIETVGGRAPFASRLSRQLEDHLGLLAEPVRTGPLITGVGDRGARVRRATYRQYTTELAGGETRPRLRAIEVDGRPAVIVSNEDLTLGLMHSSYFTINGYAPETATGLFANILLTAQLAGV